MHADQILERKGRDVATVQTGITVAEAIAELQRRNIGALVVSDDGTTVAGIVSERDVVRSLAEEGGAVLDRRVDELMVTDVVSCQPHDDAEALMELMTEGRIRHLPVVDSGQLTGIISIGDVVKTRLDELKTEAEQLVDYIRTGR